jgi:hypothetical protein
MQKSERSLSEIRSRLSELIHYFKYRSEANSKLKMKYMAKATELCDLERRLKRFLLTTKMVTISPNSKSYILRLNRTQLARLKYLLEKKGRISPRKAESSRSGKVGNKPSPKSSSVSGSYPRGSAISLPPHSGKEIS